MTYLLQRPSSRSEAVETGFPTVNLLITDDIDEAWNTWRARDTTVPMRLITVGSVVTYSGATLLERTTFGWENYFEILQLAALGEVKFT